MSRLASVWATLSGVVVVAGAVSISSVLDIDDRWSVVGDVERSIRDARAVVPLAVRRGRSAGTSLWGAGVLSRAVRRSVVEQRAAGGVTAQGRRVVTRGPFRDRSVDEAAVGQRDNCGTRAWKRA